ncbi:UPF0505 protein isoform X2 [Amborella trichopoda]|uniref:UPF0505 protein isoform X2 n=1 Tax=Amborella trichopoda TaxID=13333 RepID=UPI0009BE2474|nr:UPF0505 protein isoform X2 [Amborella trichopoda]|eukprot:XP_020524770.1 UPF0505 protein isoform X2 [Amborella trichopoda]
MVVEFRVKDYVAEDAAHSLRRTPTTHHPLSNPTSSFHQNHQQQNHCSDREKVSFSDPLTQHNVEPVIFMGEDVKFVSKTAVGGDLKELHEVSRKEWVNFNRTLMQKFPVAKTIRIASTSDVIFRNAKASGRSLTTLRLEELDDPQKIAVQEVKVITQQDYVLRLRELNDEIAKAWKFEDRVTALKLSIKVTRLLSDTSVKEFYPTLFVLVTNILDTLGSLVWERIKRKAEYDDNGTLVCCLPENFTTKDVRSEAKETCNNWFCKIGSIRELLPRIYLELAILRCWHFLQDSSLDALERLTMMIRGLADPLASAYCRLYMTHCAQELLASDSGFLITSVNDITTTLSKIVYGTVTTNAKSLEDRKLLLSLLEPSVEWITKCLFKYRSQLKCGDILVDIASVRNNTKLAVKCFEVSVILHNLLRELSTEIVGANALGIIDMIEKAKDISLDQYLNYRLLGYKLCESSPPLDTRDAILNKVFHVIDQFSCQMEYLMVLDVYLDFILQHNMDEQLNLFLDNIWRYTRGQEITEHELHILESILLRLIAHFADLTDVLALDHFFDIFDVLYGTTRRIVSGHILAKANWRKRINDSSVIEFLFEVSQALHDSGDVLASRHEHRQAERHVDFGADLEHHLNFLIECRSTFHRMDELKEYIIHSSNYLAIKASSGRDELMDFCKACIAFNEVTIPSLSSNLKRVALLVETAEVALQCGLISHSDSLINAAIDSLHHVTQNDDIIFMYSISNIFHQDILAFPFSCSSLPFDEDQILSYLQKLCSLLVMVPGSPELGIGFMLKKMLALVNSLAGMTSLFKAKAFIAILLLTSTLSQKKLPYHIQNKEVVGNDLLFLGDLSYYEDVASISWTALQNILDCLLQVPNSVTQGNGALEACDSITMSLKLTDEVSKVCYELIGIAQSSLPQINQYLKYLLDVLNRQSLKSAAS